MQSSIDLVEEVTRMIAKVRGHNPDRCNEKCQCRPLALDIVVLAQQQYAAERNHLSEMLDDKVTELQRLKRLVGEEA